MGINLGPEHFIAEILLYFLLLDSLGREFLYIIHHPADFQLCLHDSERRHLSALCILHIRDFCPSDIYPAHLMYQTVEGRVDIEIHGKADHTGSQGHEDRQGGYGAVKLVHCLGNMGQGHQVHHAPSCTGHGHMVHQILLAVLCIMEIILVLL